MSDETQEHKDSGSRSADGRAIICTCGLTYWPSAFAKHCAAMVARQRRENYKKTRTAPYYVYVLADPRTGNPFYVGKGTQRRAWSHEARWALQDGANPAKAARLLEIRECGLRVDVRVVAVFGSDPAAESLAFAFEAALIDILPHDLVNVTLSRYERSEFADRRITERDQARMQSLRRKYDPGPVNI